VHKARNADGATWTRTKYTCTKSMLSRFLDEVEQYRGNTSISYWVPL
jgi:hypothetical protein